MNTDSVSDARKREVTKQAKKLAAVLMVFAQTLMEKPLSEALEAAHAMAARTKLVLTKRHELQLFASVGIENYRQAQQVADYPRLPIIQSKGTWAVRLNALFKTIRGRIQILTTFVQTLLVEDSLAEAVQAAHDHAGELGHSVTKADWIEIFSALDIQWHSDMKTLVQNQEWPTRLERAEFLMGSANFILERDMHSYPLAGWVIERQRALVFSMAALNGSLTTS